jgi:hypothetical protein
MSEKDHDPLQRVAAELLVEALRSKTPNALGPSPGVGAALAAEAKAWTSKREEAFRAFEQERAQRRAQRRDRRPARER